MFGIGPAEGLIVLVIAVLLFGGPVLVFFLGYQLGKRNGSRGSDAEPQQEAPATHDTSLKDEADKAWEEYAEDE